MATEHQGNLGKSRFGPSDRLFAMFRACSRDPTEAIKARLRRMLHTFLQHPWESAGSEMTKELAKKCCREAEIVYYYRILEKHASQERNRLGISDITAIFENDLFQSYLVACCLEISISSNGLPCVFPLLPQILKLSPYHFWKVIELVLRAEEGLPRAVFKHLTQVEQRILESLAWTSDSPLWEEIRANKGHLPTCQQAMPPSQLDPKRADLKPDGNLPGASGAETSAGTDQQSSSAAVNRPRRSSSLHLFARKVYSLMGKRLRELCSTLNISDELRLKIWTCFEYSLVHWTELMVDRHLDQLLMCAIYIIAKITRVEIPFKCIMMGYKSQPLASKTVCKSVLISGRDTENYLSGENKVGDASKDILTPNTPSAHYPGPCQEERGHLICFYNQVYILKMQNFAKQFAQKPGVDTPPLSPYPRQWTASSCRRRVSSRHSVFISLYNTETAPPQAPGLCYYFNRSTSEHLREINDMIKTGRSPNRQSLDGEEEEEGEDGHSAKRRCRDGPSAWQRRLSNVANERVRGSDRDQQCGVTKSNLH